MIADDSSILHFSAIALILAFLTARIAIRKLASLCSSFLARCTGEDNCAIDRIFEKQHIPALKKCPNCAEQLPLSVLCCDACDYNFLSGMVGHGHKLLPPPEPLVREMPTQKFAYRA